MITEPLDEDICAGRHGGNPESVAAGKETNRARDGRRILNELEGFPEGLTCDELEQHLGMSHQTCSARCAELKKNAFIQLKWFPGTNGRAEKRPTRTGSMAAVLVLA
jgi:response regulator of citrate/malate metabolism